MEETPKQQKLDYLAHRVSESEAGKLYNSAHELVFGTGNPDADLMVVGDAPGPEEGQAGEPFMGPAGQLLDKILFKCGMMRDQVYMTDLVKRPPPESRAPTPAEVELFAPYLYAQIRIVEPKALLALGRLAGNFLAEFPDAPVGALREDRELRFVHDRLGIDLPLVVTYHPSYVLKQLQFGPATLGVTARDVKRAVKLSKGG